MNFRQLALVGVAALALGGTTAVAQDGQGQIAQATPPPPPPPNGSVSTPAAPGGPAAPAGTATPTVTMPPQPTATPSAAPETDQGGRGGRGRRGGGRGASPSANASETPEPPQFQTMTGVWEVQLQPMDHSGKTIYSHLYVTQAGDALTGYWIRSDKRRLTFTGTFDGRLFKIAFAAAPPTPTPVIRTRGKAAPTATPTAAPASPLATAPTELTYTMSGYAENFGDIVGILTSNDPADKGTPFTASHRKKERNAIGVQ